MDKVDFLQDTLTATQRSIELSQRDFPEDDRDVEGLQIFSNPAYTQTPQTDRLEIVGPSKGKPKKNASEFDLQQLLALAELRYIEDSKLLLRGIAASKFKLAVSQTLFMLSLYPRIKQTLRLLALSYLYRWKCAAIDNHSKTISRARVKGTAVSLLRLCHRRLLQKAFVIFRESCTTTAFIREIWGDRTHKLSRFVAPPKPKVTTADLLRLAVPAVRPVAGQIKSVQAEREPETELKLDAGAIQEFKAVLKQRYRAEDSLIRRPNLL
jgi:hypothetical protein